MTALAIAQQWLADYPGDDQEADLMAQALVAVTADLESLRQRYATSQQQLNAAHHEIERLRARPAPWVPAVHVRCDGRCGAVVAFDPAPEEAAMTQALVALGWSGHYCRGCRNAG